MAPVPEQLDSYYSVLGLERSASNAEIQKAYKRLALRHHPDKNLENREQAEETFKRISKAYAVLSDPQQRKVYDCDCDRFAQDAWSGGTRPRTGGLSDEQADRLFQAVFGAKGAPKRSTFSFDSPFDCPDEKCTFGADHCKSPSMNMDDLLGGIFSGLGGIHSHAPERKAQPRMPQPPQPPQQPPQQPRQVRAIAVGTHVVIRGLQSAPQHNGKTGRILRYDGSKGRYDVALGDITLSLKPQSLTQRCKVRIVNYEAKPELNGKYGEIVNYDSSTQQYMLLMQDSPVAVSMDRSYCMLELGTSVIVSGLSQERFNSQLAEIVEVHPEAARYSILCQTGETIKVKFDKVTC